MAFHGSGAVWGAACVGLVAALGCNDYEPFPPPISATVAAGGGVIPGGGGSGGASSGSGGTSASGGTGGSGGTTAPLPNPCECAYASLFNATCGPCVNDATSGACKLDASACDGDAECKKRKECPQTCSGMPDKAACIQECLLPLDNHPYTVYSDCICQACAASCGTDQPIACQ